MEDDIFVIYKKLIESKSLDEVLKDMESGNDHDESKTMSEEDFKEFERRIQKGRALLYRDYPNFGIILTRLRTVPTDDIPTMAVDNFGNIFINPDFACKQLTFDEMLGVLAHECFHHANLTFNRQGNRIPELWNIATDYIMNRDLLEMGMQLPVFGCIPKQGHNKWLIGELNNLDITNMTSEELYNILAKEQQESKKSQQKIDALGEKQQQLDKHIQPSERGGEPKPLNTPSGDEAYKPQNENMSKQQAANQAKERASAAAQEAQRVSGRGTGRGGPRSLTTNIFQPKTDWKQLLKNFFISGSMREYTWKKPAKRAMASGYYAPKSREIESKLDVVVAVDTSGSITNDVLNAFYSELLAIAKTAKHVKIIVLLFHTEVYREVILDTTKESVNSLRSKLLSTKLESGGTTLTSVYNYLKQQATARHESLQMLQGFVVFTDGMIEDNPIIPPAKNKLFMIVSNGNPDILKKYGPTYEIEIL